MATHRTPWLSDPADRVAVRLEHARDCASGRGDPCSCSPRLRLVPATGEGRSGSLARQGETTRRQQRTRGDDMKTPKETEENTRGRAERKPR